MKQNLQKKYGLVTTICLVVGAVIGSGIFFQNETIFARVGGDLRTAVGAWVIGGAIMFVMMWVWGQLAIGKVGMGGLMEYTDDLLGKKYSYFLGWFLGTVLYPAFVAILAWITAQFTGDLLGWSPYMRNTGGQIWMLAGVYMIGVYVMNVISPKLAGFFQVSTTFIKVVPLLLMGVIGLVVGLTSGQMAENMELIIPASELEVTPLFYAILATAFAYGGSEEVLMMSSEIKDREKNLPRGIIIGAIIIIAIYVLYTIGVYGSMDVATLSAPGGVRRGFLNVFGTGFGNVLTVFIIISCLGAMNSAMMAGSRAFYALAIRGTGPGPEYVKQVDKKTDMPPTSAAMSLLFCGLAFFIIFSNTQDMMVYNAITTENVGLLSASDQELLAQSPHLMDPDLLEIYPQLAHQRWFGRINLGLTALAPVTLMAFYIPVFAAVMKKKTDWNVLNRFVMPMLAILGGLFMIYMVFYNSYSAYHGEVAQNWWQVWHAPAVWIYLIGFTVLMSMAAVFQVYNKNQSENK